MQLNLKKLASLEANFKLPHNKDEGVTTNIGHSETFTFILDALRTYYQTPVDDVETLESLFPIFQDLQEMGIVTDAPEMEEIEDEDEEENDENSEEEEE
jgi:hypothetical protein